MDRSTPTSSSVGAGSNYSFVDVDNVSSPETLCPSSPGSDILMNDDPATDSDNQPSVTVSKLQPSKANSASLVFPVSLKDLNLREIKAVKIIRNGSNLVSSTASAVLGGIKSTSSHVPEAIKKLLGPVQLSVATPAATTTPSSSKTSYPPIVLSGNFLFMIVTPTH